MSGFSCFSILKSQAKQIAKGQGLKHSEALEQVALSANFSSFHDMQKCAVANPREPRLVKAALGVTDLKDALHHDGVSMALELEINQRLSEATQFAQGHQPQVLQWMADTAHYDDKTGVLSLGLAIAHGRKSVSGSYSGPKYFLRGQARLMRRDNAWMIAPNNGLTLHGYTSGVEWADKADEQAYFEGLHMDELREQSLEPFSVVLSRSLEISVSEAEQLVDAEITVNASDDGLIYGHMIDVEGYASPQLARRLLDRFGTLQIALGPNFYDQVRAEYD
jgi:hypothetical protein